jgi:hypothetical protein
VVTAFIAAAIIRVVFVVVVKKTGFPTYRTRGILSIISFSLRPRAFGSKLMTAHQAAVLLITIRVLAETMKVLRVVALRAAERV